MNRGEIMSRSSYVKYDKSLKTTPNSIGPTIYGSGTPDSKLLLILFSLKQYFLAFKYEL